MSLDAKFTPDCAVEQAYLWRLPHSFSVFHEDDAGQFWTLLNDGKGHLLETGREWRSAAGSRHHRRTWSTHDGLMLCVMVESRVVGTPILTPPGATIHLGWEQVGRRCAETARCTKWSAAWAKEGSPSLKPSPGRTPTICWFVVVVFAGHSCDIRFCSVLFLPLCRNVLRNGG